MYYINAITSISHQNSFRNEGFSINMNALSQDSKLLTPDYKKILNIRKLRRMSKILRMSTACAIECQGKIDNTVDGIVVGTGLGCLEETEKFLKTIINIKGLLPPTSFIHSTHNTIAGQLSINLKNTGYNMTHTQSNVSFEAALLDAMMCIEDGMKNVMIGAADEFIPFLKDINNKLNLNVDNLTSGATFLILSKEKNNETIAQLLDCKIIDPLNQNLFLESFLEGNNVNINELDKIVYSKAFSKDQVDFGVPKSRTISINKYSGCYLTNAAFGMHIGVDQISQKKAKKVLVYNAMYSESIGLTLVESAS